MDIGLISLHACQAAKIAKKRRKRVDYRNLLFWAGAQMMQADKSDKYLVSASYMTHKVPPTPTPLTVCA